MFRPDLTFLNGIREEFSYDRESGLLRRAGVTVGWPNGNGYLRVRFRARKIYVHQVAVFLVTGNWLVGPIDHANGDRSDNRWGNLRPCTHSQNMQNSKKQANGTQPYKGIERFPSGRWGARIMADGESRRLGSFGTPEAAHAAYAAAAARLHGEFARLA